MKLLSEVGVLVASERALKLLDAAGAQVDYENEIVKIPENLVRESISLATETPVKMFDRAGNSLIRLEGKKTFLPLLLLRLRYL